MSRVPVSRVQVGIVSWNTAELLDRCLAGLPAALEGTDATVRVVDNASTDESVDTARGHPGVEVVRNDENAGYATAMNQALASPDAEVLIALNPDTEPEPGSLATLARRLLEQHDVGCCVPRLVNQDGTLQHSVYRFPSPRQAAAVLFTPRALLRRGVKARWWPEGYAPHDHSTDIDWAIGAVHAIRADALSGRQPYDERWFMYVEDLDLCWRLSRDGWRRRLEADVTVMHVGNAAGVQAWGDARTERWMTASYAWYAQTFGVAAARRWAAVNVTAIGARLAAAAPGALLGHEWRRNEIRELRRIAPVNLRGLRRPANPQAGPPQV